MATRTYVDSYQGLNQQFRTVEISAGAASGSQIPNLNASGILDSTIVNSTVASAGAASAAKLVALDASGKIDLTLIPSSVGADSLTFTTSETIAPSSLVNIFNSTGAKVRNADASTGRVAHGFTVSGGASGTVITVYFEGSLTGLVTRTPGARQFLGAAGATTETAPVVGVSGVAAGYYCQVVGVAESTTALAFEADEPVILA